MICIERSYLGFKVSVKDIGFGRYSVNARSVDEAANSVKHYYGEKGHLGKKCPLCRRMAEEYAKETRKIEREQLSQGRNKRD